MRFTIRRVKGNIRHYDEILNKYNVVYYYTKATITIDTLEKLMELQKSLGTGLIVDGNEITTYDDYIE